MTSDTAPFPFVDALAAEERAIFDEAVRPVHLDPGALICLEGDRCQALPLVVSGEARVYRTSPGGRVTHALPHRARRELHPDGLVPAQRPPVPSVRRGRDARRSAPPASRRVRLPLREAAPLREHVFSLLARRLGDVIELVDAVAFQRVDERLARHLLDQAGDDGRVARTHEALAEALGTSREVVSRTLKEFERREPWRSRAGSSPLLDAAALRATALCDLSHGRGGPGLPILWPHSTSSVMKKNMGSIDRGFRAALAVLVAVLYFTGVINGTVAIVLGVLALVFLATSFVGTCPLYLPFGLSTLRRS